MLAWLSASDRITQPGSRLPSVRERRPVRDVARGEEQRRRLAVQVGELALQQHVVVGGAGDVAGAAGAGAAAVDRRVHRRQHRRVLAHAEIVVRAPDGDLGRPVRRRSAGRAGSRRSAARARRRRGNCPPCGAPPAARRTGRRSPSAVPYRLRRRGRRGPHTVDRPTRGQKSTFGPSQTVYHGVAPWRTIRRIRETACAAGPAGAKRPHGRDDSRLGRRPPRRGGEARGAPPRASGTTPSRSS